MRTLTIALLYCAAATAQDTVLTNRLAADLAPLSQLKPYDGRELALNPELLARDVRAALRASVERLHPEQAAVIARFARDFSERYNTPVIPWNTAYVLTTVLAGRELPMDSLDRLAAAMLRTMDDATHLRPFLLALRDVIAILRELGVSDGNLALTVHSFGTAAKKMAEPPPLRVQPIPPAYPQRGPDRI